MPAPLLRGAGEPPVLRAASGSGVRPTRWLLARTPPLRGIASWFSS
ncbi:hypothetical protein [Prosthecobacter vanneervenii]|uniref:Uncharacterized protein n=1 Tax=Prosthecobacter vanneervenii TaxID=48466 RepID=A0A7W7YGF6_9BACT|nr:hypothetical protein [Prosthecobacter vanneervenii]MBB5035722.1 hypothetical protein [Prosthecobacter vanneervenii]